ncbi:Uma2 family endonuclease [Streptomyces sp. NPDC060194]|uniref:Uma2 family endonuclease n=1 Tax=Streptomyces sp. NPDC060194 TaxID=3347069 RepID=UPI00366803E5
MTAEPIPDWFYPPPGGWTVDDLSRLPADAPAFELIDGALIMMSPQTDFHSVVMRRLANAIEDVVPADEPPLRVVTEMTVRLAKRQGPEPDVLIVNAPRQGSRTQYLPSEVVLAVEIVSAESEERDRQTKPFKYAQAGIRHFWRIENEKDKPVVHTYELDDTTGAYVATGIHRGTLDIAAPFPMTIALDTLY